MHCNVESSQTFASGIPKLREQHKSLEKKKPQKESFICCSNIIHLRSVTSNEACFDTYGAYVNICNSAYTT